MCVELLFFFSSCFGAQNFYAEVRAKALWFCSGGGGVFSVLLLVLYQCYLVLLVFYYRAAAAKN